MDEWLVLDDWTQSPSTAAWCFEHHNGHRYPLAKALWLGALRVTGYRFGAPQFLTLAFQISAAMLVLWTARGLRGRSHPADAIAAVLYLHLGHGLNWLMGYQLGFGLLAYAIAGWMWTAGRMSRGGGRGWAILSAAYCVPILLCGGFGIAFAPAVVLWMAHLGYRTSRTGRVGYGIAAVLAAAYAGWVVATLPPMVEYGYSPIAQPLDFFGVAGGYLGVALGHWPAVENPSPVLPAIVCGTVAGAYVAGSLRLARRIVRNRGDDPLDVVLFLVILGTLLVAAAAARARPAAMLGRYAIASAGGLVALALSFAKRDAPRPGRRSAGLGALVAILLAVGLWHLNEGPGISEAYRFGIPSDDLAADIRAGEPALVLVGKHSASINTLCGEKLSDYLRHLKEARIPPFAAMPDDPPYRAEAIAREPVIWKEKPAPLDIPAPPAGVIGLRLVADSKAWSGRSKLLLKWIDSGTGQSREEGAYPPYFPGAVRLVFKTTGTPTRVRLEAAVPPIELHLSQFEWLIAAPGR